MSEVGHGKTFSLSEIYRFLVDRGFFGSNREPREFILNALDRVEKAVSEGKVALVRAPPGSGKTAISITAAVHSLLNSGKSEFLQVIHVVPTRSLVEDIYLRVREGFRRLSTELEALVSRQYGLVHESPFLTGAFIVSTLDTYFYNIIKIPLAEASKIGAKKSLGHYEIPRSSIFSSLSFLDEAHMFLEEVEESKGASTLTSLVRSLALTKTPTILSTATLPDQAIDSLAGVVQLEVIDYGKLEGDSFFQREVSKKFHTLEVDRAKSGVIKVESPESLIPRVIEEILDGNSVVGRGTVAILVNTVHSARNIFKKLRSRGIEAVLLHSKFTPEDKEKKLEYLRKSSRAVLVSTQVIEVGVDIAFDVVISELATPSSIVQRFGRLARGDKSEGWWLVFYTEDTIKKGSGVYNANLVARAKKYLEKVGKAIHWHLPKLDSDRIGYLDFINMCWSEYNLGRNLDVENIILSPSIDSTSVLSFIEAVGGLLRDENLCTIYLIENERDAVCDAKSLIENQHKSAITLRCSEVAETLDEALKQGYPAKVLYRKTLERRELECRNASIDDVETLKNLREIFSKDLVAVLLPREDFYEGGVFGEGFKKP